MVTRVDLLGRLDAKHLMPNGAVRIPANLTRTGVFVYRRTDGSTVRELRHPEDVFHEDAMRSLESAVVTEGHPGMVSPSNWRALAVGSPYGVRKDGKFVASDLIIHAPETINRIDRGDLQELSCGYECDLVSESGEYEKGLEAA